jgi:NAD(P)-dependent dehydrogenase (short-subunit alcohol dehydrogenase family)
MNIGAYIVDHLAHRLAPPLFNHVGCPGIFNFDVTDHHTMIDYFSQFPETDTLILSHGITHLDWFEDQPISRMEQMIEVNLTGTMSAISHFVRETMEQKYLKYVVVIGSMAHRQVLNASAPYCAAKAGVAHLVRCLGYELAPKGYRVFCVHPSNVAGTPMTEQTVRGLMRYREIPETVAWDYWQTGQIMPVLLPGEIAKVVGELVDGRHDHLSGTQIELTGAQR